MKTPKTYRLSDLTLDDLSRLCEMWPTCSETELVERAIHEFRFHSMIYFETRASMEKKEG